MKKSFTIIELTVVIAVILILTTIVLVGFGRSQDDEGTRADYLQLYDDLKSLQLRANLGKQTGGKFVQSLSFTVGQTTYSINGVQKSFPNHSVFRIVRSGGYNYTSGQTLLVSFYPNVYTGPVPTGNQYIYCTNCQNQFDLSAVNIFVGTLTGNSAFPIVLTGSGYKVTTINKAASQTVPGLPTATPTNSPTPTPCTYPATNPHNAKDLQDCFSVNTCGICQCNCPGGVE